MNNIIAIICPDKNHVEKELNISDEKLVKNEENEDLKKLIIDELLKLVIEANFDGYEKVKYIINTFIRYTAENSSMTNTMKIVKKEFELRFKERTDKLYEFIPFK